MSCWLDPPFLFLEINSPLNQRKVELLSKTILFNKNSYSLLYMRLINYPEVTKIMPTLLDCIKWSSITQVHLHICMLDKDYTLYNIILKRIPKKVKLFASFCEYI